MGVEDALDEKAADPCCLGDVVHRSAVEPAVQKAPAAVSMIWAGRPGRGEAPPDRGKLAFVPAQLLTYIYSRVNLVAGRDRRAGPHAVRAKVSMLGTLAGGFGHRGTDRSSARRWLRHRRVGDLITWCTLSASAAPNGPPDRASPWSSTRVPLRARTSLRGGIVAYARNVKQTLLQVDASNIVSERAALNRGEARSAFAPSPSLYGFSTSVQTR